MKTLQRKFNATGMHGSPRHLQRQSCRRNRPGGDGALYRNDRGCGAISQLWRLLPTGGAIIKQRIQVIIAYIEARPQRMHEDFRVLAVEAMQKAWPCKN